MGDGSEDIKLRHREYLTVSTLLYPWLKIGHTLLSSSRFSLLYFYLYSYYSIHISNYQYARLL